MAIDSVPAPVKAKAQTLPVAAPTSSYSNYKVGSKRPLEEDHSPSTFGGSREGVKVPKVTPMNELSNQHDSSIQQIVILTRSGIQIFA